MFQTNLLPAKFFRLEKPSKLQTNTLLSKTTSQEEKRLAAKRIIDIYHLSLAEDEIIQAFTKIIEEKGICAYEPNESRLEVCTFLFTRLLSLNKDMYVALIKTIVYGKIFKTYDVSVLVIENDRYLVEPVLNYTDYRVGCRNCVSVGKIYRKILDHGDFEIDNLLIPLEHLYEIRDYRKKKYGPGAGKLTKAATKN